MKNKLIVLSGFAMGLMAPIAVFAQGISTGTGPTSTCNGASVTDIPSLLCKISSILNAIIPVLVLLGVVFFVYGVITYVISNDEEAKKKGRDRIIFGIIGLAVIVGVWGLVRILTNTFNLSNQNSTTLTLPTIGQ